MTKPLAGRVGARIVGTIGGTAHRPPIMNAPSGVAHSAGGASTADTHYTTTDSSPATFHTPMYPVNRPRAKDNDEPAELPSRPTL